MSVNYKIENKKITLLDDKYWMLSGELNTFGVEDINNILQDMENVFNEKYKASSFNHDVAVVDFNSHIAKISYFDKIIGEEPTLDIYNMLKNYQKILIECNKVNVYI